jgi:hypothetical protein
MNIINIRCIKEKREEYLLRLLKGNIFHVTTFSALKGIRKSRYVKSNKDHEFEYNYHQSENSYGRKHGYVCLFDFRTIKKPDIVRSDRKYGYFYSEVYLLLDKRYWGIVKTPKDCGLPGDYSNIYIPESEVFYPHDIEISKIDTCIRVHVTDA